MASLFVMSAVRARVAASWSHTNIIDPNDVAAVPADGSAFLSITYPVMTEQQISFGAPGANVHEEDGAFRIGLFIPIGIGVNPDDSPWQSRLELLMEQFRAAQFSGIDCLGFSGPTINDETDDGAYFELSFAVSYRRFIRG